MQEFIQQPKKQHGGSIVHSDWHGPHGTNTRAPTYVKETLLKLKLHIKPHTLIVGDFNTPLAPVVKSTRQQLNRRIRELRDVMIQMNLTDIYL